MSSTTLTLSVPFKGTTALYQTSLLLKEPHPGSTMPDDSVEFTVVPSVLTHPDVLTGMVKAPHGWSLAGGVRHEMVPVKPEETPFPFESSLKLIHPPIALW